MSSSVVVKQEVMKRETRLLSELHPLAQLVKTNPSKAALILRAAQRARPDGPTRRVLRELELEVSRPLNAPKDIDALDLIVRSLRALKNKRATPDDDPELKRLVALAAGAFAAALMETDRDPS